MRRAVVLLSAIALVGAVVPCAWGGTITSLTGPTATITSTGPTATITSTFSTPNPPAATTPASQVKGGSGHPWLYIVAAALVLLGATAYFRGRPGGYAGRRDDDPN